MVQISQSLGVMMVTLMLEKDVKLYIREGGVMVWFWLLGLSPSVLAGKDAGLPPKTPWSWSNT